MKNHVLIKAYFEPHSKFLTADVEQRRDTVQNNLKYMIALQDDLTGSYNTSKVQFILENERQKIRNEINQLVLDIESLSAEMIEYQEVMNLIGHVHSSTIYHDIVRVAQDKMKILTNRLMLDDEKFLNYVRNSIKIKIEEDTSLLNHLTYGAYIRQMLLEKYNFKIEDLFN